MDARDLDGVLEREEDAFAGPLLGGQVEQVLTFKGHGPFGDLIRLAAGEHLRERALARAVAAHDRVHLAGVDRQVDALEDHPLLAGGDAGVEVFDFK